MRSPTNVWVVSTCLHLMLLSTENTKFHLEQKQLKCIKSTAALQLPLLSQYWTVLGTRNIPYRFWARMVFKVPVNAFCEGTWAVLYVTALSCCYYICLAFQSCFRSQSFRYLMQNNKGERGQNLLTNHLSSSQEVLIPHFHGDHAILCFFEATPPSQLQRRRCWRRGQCNY